MGSVRGVLSLLTTELEQCETSETCSSDYTNKKRKISDDILRFLL